MVLGGILGGAASALNPFSGITDTIKKVIGDVGKDTLGNLLGGNADPAPAAPPVPVPAPAAPAPEPAPAAPVQPVVEPQPEISLEDLLTQVDELFTGCQTSGCQTLGITNVDPELLTDLKSLPQQTKAMRTELMNLPRDVISDDITKEFLTAEKQFYEEFQEVQQKFQEVHENMIEARMKFEMLKLKSNAINPGSAMRAAEAAQNPAPVAVDVEIVAETPPPPTDKAWWTPPDSLAARRLAQAPVTESSYVWPMMAFVLCFVILMGILNFAFRRVKKPPATPSFRFETIKIVH